MNSQEYSADASFAQVSICAFCGKMFSHRKECANHVKTCDKFYVLPETVLRENPESPKEKKALQCQFCSKAFTLNKNCNRHEKVCFKNDTPFSGFLCAQCGLSFNRKDNFIIHKKRCEETGVEGQPDAEPSSSGEETGVEKLPYKPKARAPCLYPYCDKKFYHKRILIDHLKESHKCDINDPISKLFDSVEEFLAWKDEIQEKTFSYFSQKSGPFSRNQKKYYYCQHDGICSPRKTNRTNLKGRVKVGDHCIAKMEAWKESSGKISVLYFSTHSHICASADFVHHPVSKENNDFINKRLALSVPPRKAQKKERYHKDETIAEMRDNALLLSELDDSLPDSSEQPVNKDPENPNLINIAPKNEAHERPISKQSKDLDENLTYLSDFLKISHNASALSHAASVMSDLVLQLKYMTEEDKKENVKDIVHMEPALKFSSTETLKTQLSQISSFKKPLLKRKASKQAGVSPMKKQCVIKDPLVNCTEDEAGTDKPH